MTKENGVFSPLPQSEASAELLKKISVGKAEITRRRELLSPLRDGFKQLILTYGETPFKPISQTPIIITEITTRVSDFMRRNFGELPSIFPRPSEVENDVLATSLEMDGSDIEVLLWRDGCFNERDRIFVEFKYSGVRLLLPKRLERTEIQELKIRSNFLEPIKRSDYTSRFPSEEEIGPFTQILGLLQEKFSE